MKQEKNSFNFLFSSKINTKNELVALVILILAILIFFIPLLSMKEGICFDDAALVSFPKLVAIARAFQNGEIALWDKNSFAGGKPFYLTLESPIYNVLYYPFFLLANPNNLNQSFLTLYILPFVFFIMLSAVGMYLLIRLYFRLNPLLSICSAFLWSINPSLAMSTYSTVNTVVFSFIPWIILSIAKFYESKKTIWLITGFLSLFFINSAYTLNYSFRIYFLIGIIFLFLSIWHIRLDRKSIYSFFALVLMFIFGFLASSHVWVGILEGVNLTGNQIKMSYKDIVSVITNNMPPAHLITLFIPNFNGSLDTNYAWGDGLLIFSPDRILTGGIFTSFVIIFFAIILFKKREYIKDLDKKYYFWGMLAFFINLVTLLVMLAGFTPVYLILCKILPWFFVVPYPYYYHFAHHFSSVVLISISLHLLFNEDKEIKRINNSFIFYYIGFIVFFIFLYLFLPVPALKQQGYYYLTKFKQWDWFISGPISYFTITSCIIILVFLARIKRYSLFKYIVLLFVIIEALFIGYNGFYKNMTVPRVQNLSNWEKMQRIRYRLPEENPIYNQIDQLKFIAKSNKRWVSDVTTLDCLSWVVDAKALGGYDSKPLLPKLESILKTFYERFPYELVSYSFPKELLRNLNVGYLLAYDNIKEENNIYEHIINGDSYYLIRKLETYKKFGDYFQNFKGPNFKVFKLDEPLGEFFLQKRFYKADDSVQKELLLKEDLRKFALFNVRDNVVAPVFEEKYREAKDYMNEFEALQKESKIEKLIEKNNSIILKLNIDEDALLIRNEVYHPAWKVFIDGKEQKLYEVNYLQQGVFVSKGEHIVKFLFNPEKIITSVYISIFSLVTFFILFLFLFIAKRNSLF